MKKKQHITSCQERRWEAVSVWKHHQHSSFSVIAKKIHCSHAFVSRWVRRYQQFGHVNDQPRSGRPPKADAAAVQQVLMAAELPECSTVRAIADRTEQDLGVHLSNSTVKRVLKGQGLQHMPPKVIPLLTARHKLARVKFAKSALRRELVSWRRVMITDSKYFYLHNMGRPASRWCTPATRGTAARPKSSIHAHVYMGMSNWGTTTLKFVTGTHKQVSKYVDPKTQRLHKGVGQAEYNDVIMEHWVPEGNRLFQQAGMWAGNWQLQQDNAPPHKTAKNMACIAAEVPGGHFLRWPANSPDLSPIENLWAWMDDKLHTKYHCESIEKMEVALEAIRQSIPASTLRKYFDHMDLRMNRVIELNGDYIGK